MPAVGGEEAPNLMAHLVGRQIDVVHGRFADPDSLRDAVRTGAVEVGRVVDAGSGKPCARAGRRDRAGAAVDRDAELC